MTWEPRPIPKVTPESAEYWEAATDGRLLIRQCVECGFTYVYPRSHCPECYSTKTEWLEAEGSGKIYSYSVVDEAPGWPESALPLIPAYVELSEGPRMVTAIVDCRPANLKVGMSVLVNFVETTDDAIAIPVFSPTYC